jgi:uncharacterized protein
LGWGVSDFCKRGWTRLRGIETVSGMLNIKAIVHRVLEEYALPLDGIHGVGHWARVLENGLRLAGVTGANRDVVQLFAAFHDSCRVNEALDGGHGRRGAELAARLRGSVFDLADREFDLLYAACAGHTDGQTDADVTIQTCWDADRLDLGRVGIAPHPKKLCTKAAKMAETIRWADERASSRIVPAIVVAEWDIVDLA